ncbi:hypothetical protein GCM10023085_58300 [Actinomadura viridis]|uniref:DUF2637 domain-containing protein n=1 Tax=Actinomadura viridis TaxID=58110 RepID=A0A931GN47_9ACTN|nr:DUF2637 domain-containing protein [Actinomadura viridis]MBG6093377.1 hypothetical protein [Actinomadura viridis]
MPPVPQAPPESRPARRRLPAVAAGLVVAVLAGGAFVLTYDLLRDLAVAGGAGRRWAPAYPVMADALVVMTILSLVVARNARWWSRWLRGALLLLLLTGTAAIAVQHALWGFGPLPETPVRAGVAVAPHVMLVIAVWLWLRMIRHLRPRSGPAPSTTGPAHASERPADAADAAAGVEEDATGAVPSKPAPPPLALLPSDVEVARSPESGAPGSGAPGSGAVPPDLGKASTTLPDMIMPVTLDAVPEPRRPREQDEGPEEPQDETQATGVDGDVDEGEGGERPGAAERQRAEAGGSPESTDPDGIDTSEDLPIWDWDPPSGSLRSSPTPPAE